jgi:hypothetical protein
MPTEGQLYLRITTGMAADQEYWMAEIEQSLLLNSFHPPAF